MSLPDELTQLETAITGVGTAINEKDTGLEQLIAGCAGLKVGRYVGSAAELAQEQAAAPSQATVFNSWYRFSHNTTGQFPAVASELTAWAYDTTLNQIHDTLNSTTLIGVVSNEKYSDYVLDVSLHSTNTDDDTIGLLLAWYKDPTTGAEYTLTAMRSPGGQAPLWGVVYNFAQGASFGQKTVADKSATVHWGNGASGALSAAAAGYVTNTATTGWSGQATLWGTDGHTRIYAVREGNTITLKTSLFEQPDTLLDTTLITVDLTSDPVLAKFLGSSQYGFVANSQQDSFWSVNTFTNPQDTIFNLATGTAYQNVGGTWQTTPDFTWDDIGTNVFLMNTDTGKAYFVKDQDNVLQFRAPQLIAGGAVEPNDIEPPGNYRGTISQFQTGTLSGDFWGSIIFSAPLASITAPFTTTLDVSEVTEKAPKVAFLNNSSFPWTIQLSNGGDINSSQSVGATTTLVLAPFTTAEAWYSAGGGVLWVTGGTYTQGGPGKITVSSAAPSGGSNGDTWYQV